MCACDGRRIDCIEEINDECSRYHGWVATVLSQSRSWNDNENLVECEGGGVGGRSIQRPMIAVLSKKRILSERGAIDAGPQIDDDTKMQPDSRCDVAG